MIEKMNSNQKGKSGTHEWADQNINIQTGCEHNCKYCYAKKMAIRFKRATEESWKIPIVNKDKVCRAYQKRYGKIMFPSSHDITPSNLMDCIQVIENLAIKGNSILIVTKPHLKCIAEISHRLKSMNDRIEFRFTITSQTEEISKYYEPGAPSPIERMQCIEVAKRYGFKVSISCEPLLEDPIHLLINLVTICKVTGEIWIGAMNYSKDAPKLDYLKIYNEAKQYPQVKFKDSFRKKYQIQLKKSKNQSKIDDDFEKIALRNATFALHPFDSYSNLGREDP